MQTASALSFAAALAAVPVVATAQQQTTETQAEQAVEGTAQKAQGAASEATEAAGEATQDAAQATENAAESAGQATEQAAEGAAEATEEKAEAIEQQGEDQAEAIEEQSEEQADAVEQQADQQAEAVEEQGEAAEGEQPVEEVEGTIVMQDENSILAGDLMGATIYNAAGETVGEINDAIITLDGTVEGVVIGVGGFLGIGEKSVAVEMAKISVQTDEQGDPQLVLDTTRDALEAAPEFMTVEDQESEAQATTSTAPAGGGMGTGTMTPSATPTEPATGGATGGGATAPTQ